MITIYRTAVVEYCWFTNDESDISPGLALSLVRVDLGPYPSPWVLLEVPLGVAVLDTEVFDVRVPVTGSMKDRHEKIPVKMGLQVYSGTFPLPERYQQRMESAISGFIYANGDYSGVYFKRVSSHQQ